MRSVFIVGPDKRIKLMLTYPMTTRPKLRRDPARAGLDVTDRRHKAATPVNRQQSEDLIIAGSVSDEAAKTMFPAGWRARKPYLRITRQPG